MKKELALKSILGISIAGILFSGYLSYIEFFTSAQTCSLSGGMNLLGLPVCVYGLIMYLAIFIICLLGIKD